MEANKAKLSIIEQEFKTAEKEELLRLQEEEEMRVRGVRGWAGLGWPGVACMLTPPPPASAAARAKKAARGIRSSAKAGEDG